MKLYFSHPSSFIDKNTRIGKGTKIWHFSHISKDAVIGSNCILGQNVFIGEKVKIGNNVKIQNNVSVFQGVEIEDDVFLGPSCVLTNVKNPRSEFPANEKYTKTIIKKGSTIGANATIVCGITIGTYAFVGAGSVVTENIPPYVLVYGNPARQHGWVNKMGKKIQKKLRER